MRQYTKKHKQFYLSIYQKLYTTEFYTTHIVSSVNAQCKFSQWTSHNVSPCTLTGISNDEVVHSSVPKRGEDAHN
jgi:hypothetical protein